VLSLRHFSLDLPHKYILLHFLNETIKILLLMFWFFIVDFLCVIRDELSFCLPYRKLLKCPPFFWYAMQALSNATPTCKQVCFGTLFCSVGLFIHSCIEFTLLKLLWLSNKFWLQILTSSATLLSLSSLIIVLTSILPFLLCIHFQMILTNYLENQVKFPFNSMEFTH
jgi:hypothetical protein